MNADRISAIGQINMVSEEADTNTVSGSVYTRIFTGSKTLLIQQREIEYLGGATMVKLESTGDGNYRLTSSYPWDPTRGGVSDPPTNFHGLENNMSQVDVWVNENLRSTFVSTFGTVATANAAIAFVTRLVDSFIQAGNGSATAQSDIEMNITGGTNSSGTVVTAYTTDSTQQTLLLNAFRGVAYHQVKNSIQFDTTYQRRITAASYNQIQASFVGVGQIWTTAEVVAFENTPSIWWFNLPSDYLWLKAKPRVQTIAWQKTEIEYQYYAVKEAWGLLYTAYNSATLLNF